MPEFTPPSDLATFLASGPAPVYIGFGSIVIDDPTRLTSILLEAIETSGVRAIISRGWSKIGEASASKNIFYLDDCPHEWLFQKVSAVVYHGGAGTTACGLLNSRPTVVVPFFGDQPFWGQMIANAGAGPQTISHRTLNGKNLADAITFCLTAESATAAYDIARKMRDENGVVQAVASFHRQLPRDRMGCELAPQEASDLAILKLQTSNKALGFGGRKLMPGPRGQVQAKSPQAVRCSYLVTRTRMLTAPQLWAESYSDYEQAVGSRQWCILRRSSDGV